MEISESVFCRPGEVAVATRTVSNEDGYDIRARALCSGISWGSESRVLSGRVNPGLDTLAKGEDGGSGSFPLRYGYCHVAKILEAKRASDAALIGRNVFSFSHHCTEVRLKKADAFLLPAGLPPERATLTANMETAVSLLTDAGNLVGSRVLVLGLGVVGQLCCSLLEGIPLQSLDAVDLCPHRRKLAGRVLNQQQVSISDWKGLSFGAPPKVIFELSGSVEALDQAIRIAAVGSEIIVGSWYEDTHRGGLLGTLFHKKRLRLLGSQVSGMSPRQLFLFDKGERMEFAMKLLEGRPGLDSLITHRTDFVNCPGLYRDMAENPGLYGQSILLYP